MDTCSEIQSHRDSLRVTRVVQVDLLGLIDPSLMDRSSKPRQNLRKPQSSKKARTKNGFVRGFGTSLALVQSAAMAVRYSSRVFHKDGWEKNWNRFGLKELKSVPKRNSLVGSCVRVCRAGQGSGCRGGDLLSPPRFFCSAIPMSILKPQS
jgi:hypothetical protein